jgi:subtilisin family serine protease
MKKAILLLFITIAVLSGCTAEQSNTAIAPKADGIVIALLDTGISTAAINESRVLPGYNYVESSFDTQDRINHGTAAASVIAGSVPAGINGLAENAYLVPLVVRTKTENGDQKSIPAEALAQVIIDCVDKYGVDIINISLGIKKDLEAVRKAVAHAEEKGVLVVSAAGNDGSDADFYYPAAYETVLSTGSHDKDGNVSDFSPKNGIADILAPGEDIWLASKNGKTYGARGTSFAAAHVTAVAANLLAESPNLSPKEIRDILCQSAIDVGAEGFDTDSGWGILNLEESLTAGVE